MTNLKNTIDYSEAYFEEGNKTCCPSPNIISSDGYEVCINCGLIHSRSFSYRPKRQYFSNEKVYFGNVEPVRSPFGPRTVFKHKRDHTGNYLSPKTSQNFERWDKINRGLMSGLERNLWFAVPRLNQMKSQLNIPNYIANEAFKIYVSAAKLKLTHGRTIEGIISAALYYALKLNGVPRSIDEILSVSHISKKRFMKCYKAIYDYIVPQMKLKIFNFTPQQYIDRFYEELKLSMSCRKMTMKIIGECKRKGLNMSGKDPKGIAAASLYYCSKLNKEFRTQKQICEVANVSEITLRSRLKEIVSLV